MMDRRTFLKTGSAMSAYLMGSPLGAELFPVHSADGKAKPPNIVFIHADQWRAQALGFMKEDPVLTPYLDAFHRESITFRRAVACSPVCSPNRACWFTGCYPQHHGVLKNGEEHVNPEQLLSRNFKANGYRNGYIGKWHLNGRDSHKVWKGITPEFLRSDYETWTSAIHNHDHFRLMFEEDGKAVDHGHGWQPNHITDRAIDFLNAQDDRPFNLVVSYSPPHNGSFHPDFCREMRRTPRMEKKGYAYYAPEKFEALYKDLDPLSIRPNIRTDGFEEDFQGAVLGYFGACSALDLSFGRLIGHLKQSGLWNNTVVVFSADHGEMLGSQNLMTKGIPFEESLRVPLMIHVPGQTPYEDDRLFNSVDLMPTLMGLTGQPVPDEVDGRDFSRSLSPALTSKLDPEMAFIGYAGWRGYRTKRYTYVAGVGNDGGLGHREKVYLRGKRPEAALTHMLFDLEKDPYQQEPIMKGDGKGTDAVIDDLHHELTLQLRGLKEEHLIPQGV